MSDDAIGSIQDDIAKFKESLGLSDTLDRYETQKYISTDAEKERDRILKKSSNLIQYKTYAINIFSSACGLRKKIALMAKNYPVISLFYYIVIIVIYCGFVLPLLAGIIKASIYDYISIFIIVAGIIVLKLIKKHVF